MARARAATSAARRLTYKPHGPPPWSTSTRLPRTWPPRPPERPPAGPKDRPPQPNAHDNHADRASARASTSTERPRRHFFRTLLGRDRSRRRDIAQDGHDVRDRRVRSDLGLN